MVPASQLVPAYLSFVTVRKLGDFAVYQVSAGTRYLVPDTYQCFFVVAIRHTTPTTKKLHGDRELGHTNLVLTTSNGKYPCTMLRATPISCYLVHTYSPSTEACFGTSMEPVFKLSRPTGTCSVEDYY